MRTLVTRLVKNHLTFDTGAICFLFLFIELNTQSLEDFSKKLSLYKMSMTLWPRQLNSGLTGLRMGPVMQTKDYPDKRKQEEGQTESHLGALCSSLKSSLQKDKHCSG